MLQTICPRTNKMGQYKLNPKSNVIYTTRQQIQHAICQKFLSSFHVVLRMSICALYALVALMLPCIQRKNCQSQWHTASYQTINSWATWWACMLDQAVMLRILCQSITYLSIGGLGRYQLSLPFTLHTTVGPAVEIDKKNDVLL